jgi:ribonucleoside-diphosphate reductase beta chain
MSILNIKNEKYHTDANAFLDGDLSFQRYDIVKYKQFDKLTDKQLGFFWRPEEVDVSKDSKDFKDLTANEQHIFTANLKRQILLDSVQGRAPVEAFGPITSLPELENWIITWTFSETIHSRSYTHIIRNIYSNPTKIFDELADSKEIVECADDISKYYNELIEYSQYYQLLGEGKHKVKGKIVEIDL